MDIHTLFQTFKFQTTFILNANTLQAHKNVFYHSINFFENFYVSSLTFVCIDFEDKITL